MSGLRKRTAALERASNSKRQMLPGVLAQAGQSREEALAAAGLPADAPNPLLVWREEQ